MIIRLSVTLLIVISFSLCLLNLPIAKAEDLTDSTDSWSIDNLGQKFDDTGRLFKGSKEDWMQDFWLLGRYHGQYHWTRGSNGDDNDFESRRIRYGLQTKMFNKLALHAQAISGSDINPGYNGFSELWAQWAFSPELVLTVGQQKHRFTHDRNVSSRYINYLERSMLTNMFVADYTPAVTVQGELNNTAYYGGLFSNATSKNIGEAFTDYDSGHSFLAAAYQNISDLVGTDSAYLHATYLNSDANENATNLNHFNNGFSSALILTEADKSLVTEITAGTGSEDGNAYGLNLQPGWFLSDPLQLVARYQLAFSDQEEGLSPQKRYENEVDMPAGDSYQAAYLGLNYYIVSHRLKLMQGVEYSMMDNEHAWTFSSMIRLYFGPHSGGAFPMNQTLKGRLWEHD